MSQAAERGFAEWAAEVASKPPLCGCGCGASIQLRPEHMIRGIPTFIHGHHARVVARANSAELDAWVESQRGKHFCKCGCNAPIDIARHHRKLGVPRYKYRHGQKGADNPHYRGVDKWVADNQGKHLCQCGCGTAITVRPGHHWRGRGIPSFVSGHMRRLRGPRSAKFVHDRSTLKAGRAGAYFYPSLRAEIHRRDGGRCVKCGSSDRLAVDHIVPIAEGGKGDIANGQLLCHQCHAEKTRAERRRGRERKKLELDHYRALFRELMKIVGLEEEPCR